MSWARGTAAGPGERPAMDGRAGRSEAGRAPPWTALATHSKLMLRGTAARPAERPVMDGRAGDPWPARTALPSSFQRKLEFRFENDRTARRVVRAPHVPTLTPTPLPAGEGLHALNESRNRCPRHCRVGEGARLRATRLRFRTPGHGWPGRAIRARSCIAMDGIGGSSQRDACAALRQPANGSPWHSDLGAQRHGSPQATISPKHCRTPSDGESR